ncbi:uncharacterized protein B0I36DRAFT_425694 [Microdochium trichocladiopsis]|uniref:NACHT domain-containing protein n=1 Tax=Microdochium trichocladiopsis TaxID=1682393 RepID=A0A9P8XUQ8_9PEZI|nr:uncharacterized protein B0I36DRAFT_425694 [Microdochium trichocladiopsis]KAH7014113.1 hypothetical protein B0I36DRAFT_425694 [Microdochium trichocladiopsis]
MATANQADPATRHGQYSNDAYTVGWICAISTEYVAARALLDEIHDGPQHTAQHDSNSYTLGTIGRHNVVIAVLPDGEYGTNSAAVVARDMLHSFPNVRVGLMVGIGGGAPSSKHDVRLGDVVVSAPRNGHGGVMQYDFGKTIQDRAFQHTGFLAQPPMVLRTAEEGHNIPEAVDKALQRKPRLRKKYSRPDASTDRLYRSDTVHPIDANDAECEAVCGTASSALVTWKIRDDEGDELVVHYGLIASANQLMKDATLRDRLAQDKDVLCFEMEAAGLMNHFPCLVIRGVCDYSDTHKNKIWQGYAAMTAAAYARDLVKLLTPSRVEAEGRLADELFRVNEKLGSISSDVKELGSTIGVLNSHRQRDELSRWLAAPDVSSNYHKALQLRHPGSGRRLIESEAFQTWRDQESSAVLWLHGIPGCGKTVLATTVIEHLQVEEPSPLIVLYFYFDFSNVEKQQNRNALRSVVDQLYHRNEKAHAELEALYAACYAGKRQPDPQQLQETLAKMARACAETKIYIVLDALDECTTREELWPWLQELQSVSNVHVLATSRDELDIRSAISLLTVEQQRMSVHASLIEADIESYVRATIRDHSSFAIWAAQPDVQREIETTLVEKAGGMFRWVWCQIDALKRCRDRITLRKALASLPRTLDATYSRTLKSVPPEYIDHTVRILQFLTYSVRPILLDEVVDAIAVNLKAAAHGGRRFDPRDRMPVPAEVIGYCANLVTLVRRDDLVRYDGKTITVVEELQLAHFSVKDYLTSNRVVEFLGRAISKKRACTRLAEVCLSYLLELGPSTVAAKLVKDFPFARYAAKFWKVHARQGFPDCDTIAALAEELLTNPEKWLRCYLITNPSLQDTLPEEKPWHIGRALHYASYYGLARCVQNLINQGADVDGEGGYHGNALFAALAGGQEAIVRVLLDNGPDVNLPSAAFGRYGHALQAASARGQIRIVQMLLQAGADVNGRGDEHDTALTAASRHGHIEIIRILLDAGANVNAAEGRFYGTALIAASHEGHIETIGILLDAGAHVNAADSRFYGTALIAAAFNGQEEASLMLLRRGADIHMESKRFGNALVAASIRGHAEVVRMLIAQGADIDAPSGEYFSALLAALMHNHHEVTQVLLDAGCKVTPFVQRLFRSSPWLEQMNRRMKGLQSEEV